jgi:hypothetical protein
MIGADQERSVDGGVGCGVRVADVCRAMKFGAGTKPIEFFEEHAVFKAAKTTLRD